MILPGSILCFGIIPILFYTLSYLPYNVNTEFIFIVAVILLGWLTVSFDMSIYMAFEGRRYWPSFLYEYFLDKQKSRLEEINKKINTYYDTDDPKVTDTIKRVYLEASVEKRNYPIGPSGMPEALFPTKLGNAIAAHEDYSDSRYNIDAIFYWPRIWVNLPKDLREEIDNQQAICDSLIYSSFASFSSSVFWLLYTLLTVLNIDSLNEVQSFLPKSFTSLLILSVLILLGRITYNSATYNYTQYGNIFMATIDSYADKILKLISAQTVVDKINIAKNNSSEENIANNSYEDIRRYLQYHTIKSNKSSRPLPFSHYYND